MTGIAGTWTNPGRSGIDVEELLVSDPPPFALLYRPGSDPDHVDVLVGEACTVDRLADLPLPQAGTEPARQGAAPRHDLLVLVPYRQIVERDFACRDDGTPLTALRVHRQGSLSLDDVQRLLPDVPVTVRDAEFDLDDDEYAEVVRTVISDEIGRGQGANFVIKRSFLARLPDWSPAVGLTVFRRLLHREFGSYWTFLVYTGTRTLVGASPERHVSLADSTVVMNPISGTYRYPASGPDREGLLAFLGDRKEIDELYMVLDEELKMMGRMCARGGTVTGPHVKEMARLAHTEYHISGHSTSDVRDILRESLFAPTVTGSPLESACRVIQRHEPVGRGYYSGALALVGHDAEGRPQLDSTILIRTADIDAAGRLDIGVGATVVRHSDPYGEAAETRAKAAALVSAIRGAGDGAPAARARSGATAGDPEVRRLLAERNAHLATFWFTPEQARRRVLPDLAGRRILVVDAEDTFTAMLGHQLRALGPEVTIRRYDDVPGVDEADLVVLGPGPGDPRQVDDPKISKLRALVRDVLAARSPLLAVCLGHQVLSGVLGLSLIRKPHPHQGLQRDIDLFGRNARVGFYNTFAAVSRAARIDRPELGAVEVSHDPATGEVHALRGPGLRSVQFHPESVLSQDGLDILTDLVRDLLPT
ncbi:anthranilate synthase family protein [Couchioplanes azureus]|uniref:anthranilate synthase family protein n=1 Tax=Couchioplanes caeruleus TaxID=56438 RepID=UPI001670ADF2|nr:anthranilate synthase family protein [Couchioplanes caeruleus]GGQ43735.1 phenazine-specific anthranilate synthase component I [Couchioplanes caeruleus subsp. azureus]